LVKDRFAGAIPCNWRIESARDRSASMAASADL